MTRGGGGPGTPPLPLVLQSRGMSTASPELVARLRRTLEEQPAVALAVLFGSQARGQGGAASDVDVAVRAPGADLLEVGRVLSLAVGLEVDVVDLDAAGYPLTRALVDDGVVVRERERGAGARWRSHAIASLEIDQPWFARMRDAWIHRLAARTARW